MAVGVRGRVVLEAERSVARGDLHVWIEDVTMANAPAQCVAAVVLAGVALEPGDEAGVPFALETEARPEGRRWAVRAHLDADGDGRVSAGDCVTVARYPVPDDGSELVLRVRRVG